jgi:TRAP transporter TAXI family solute receptor
MPCCRLRLVAAFTAAAVLATADAAPAQPIATAPPPTKFLRIGTGAANGTYFMIGGLIANAVSAPPGSRTCAAGGSCGVPNLIAAAQSSAGSATNLRALHEGMMESALAQGDLVYFAFNGTENFHNTTPLRELRVIADLYPETVHIVVRRDSAIQSIKDLRRRTIALGESGSGSAVTARMILAAHGINKGHFQQQLMRPGEAADALAANKLDAFFLVGGYPMPIVDDLARRVPVRLLNLEPEAAARLTARYPVFTPTDIPANTYHGQPRTHTVQLPVQWVVSADADGEMVYGLTRALWHPTTRKLFLQGHPQGRRILRDQAMRTVTSPLHPGAERFYREQGLLPPDPVVVLPRAGENR